MIRKMFLINSVMAAILAFVFFLYPPVRAALDLQDPALRQGGIPKAAWRLYHNLTPRYAAWAKERVAGGKAEGLSTSDIAGTEWPVFGSVMYLWGVESLQEAWEAGDRTAKVEPKIFAKDAIIAASDLVIDPKHASWVKKHWGEDYLRRENLFYRALIIAALTTREKLVNDHANTNLLREQVESLAKELEGSKSGLLEDYPGECYPGDVVAAIMIIKRADAVLGTDHGSFIRQASRGFTGTKATAHVLPPYAASADTGSPVTGAQGCGNSYMCLTAPEIWPALAKRWFEAYDKFFWQERWGIAGFREYPIGGPQSDWGFGVDAGPIITGFGVSASAFGVGAARKNGRFDRAFPLMAEMLATAGELPNGVLAMPRLLSNFSHAPLLGEAAILWQLTAQPEKGMVIKTGGAIPLYVYYVLIPIFLFGLWRLMAAVHLFNEVRRGRVPEVRAASLQVVLWFLFLVGALAAFAMGHGIWAMVALVFAVMLPVVKRKKQKEILQDDLKALDQQQGRIN
jgi:hypothetical protein